MMRKLVEIDISEEADEELRELKRKVKEDKKNGLKNSQSIQLLNSFNRSIQNLKNSPICGTHIPKENIPKKFVQKWDIDNLWKIDLTNYWRILYTLETNVVKIKAIVLCITDHKKYNKLFGYKKK
jgi:hypothetical protein